VDRSNKPDVIRYPRDRALHAESEQKGIPEVVLVRDVVRIVEVLNLREQSFFGPKSVLAGSMALRCFGSPRFTVYDADFSTTSETVYPETAMQKLLDYSDRFLEITAAPLVPSAEDGTVWKSAPISYRPVFTALVPDPADRTFKADVSFRGLVEPGQERQLILPYELDIWEGDTPVVFVMDPHEIMAEKILGWCVDRHVKHYADLAYIAVVSNPEASTRTIEIDYPRARSVLDAKLTIMTRVHPAKYARFPSIDALVGDLMRAPEFDAQDWRKIMYVRNHRDRFTQAFIQRAVQKIMVPRLRSAGRR
jgi:hypothetical protein